MSILCDPRFAPADLATGAAPTGNVLPHSTGRGDLSKTRIPIRSLLNDPPRPLNARVVRNRGAAMRRRAGLRRFPGRRVKGVSTDSGTAAARITFRIG